MIGLKDIEKLAELARIRMSPEEMEPMRKDIDAILGYVGQIQEVAASLGASDLEPQSGAVRNVLREDSTPHASGAYSEELLAEAPAREGNYFKVKKILGGTDVA